MEADIEAHGEPAELPEPPPLAIDAAPLPHRKSHLPKLLSRDDFRREQAKLDLQSGPSWDDEARTKKPSHDKNRVRVLRPKEDGSGMEWVTVRTEELFSRTSRWINRGLFYAMGSCAAIFVIGFAVKLASAGIVAIGDGAGADHPERRPPSPPIPNLLSSDQSDAAEALVRKFCAASHGEARLGLVRFPERARRLAAGRDFAPIQIGACLKVKRVTEDGRRFVVLAFESESSPKGYRFFAVEETADRGLLVDWELAVGYQQMEIEDFQNLRPKKAIPFRVKARPGSRWSSTFDEQRYAYYELSGQGQEFTLHAYVERTASHAALMDAHTLGGGTASMVVELLCREDGQGEPDEVEITGITRVGWFH